VGACCWYRKLREQFVSIWKTHSFTGSAMFGRSHSTSPCFIRITHLWNGFGQPRLQVFPRLLGRRPGQGFLRYTARRFRSTEQASPEGSLNSQMTFV
jgi:hypothetical protein